MSYSSLELFKATVNHEYTGEFLFYCKFSQHSKQKILEHFNLKNADLSEYFGMMQAGAVWLRPSTNVPTTSDFTRYYNDIEIPEGAFINHFGILEVPAKAFHFTKMISPLRNAESMDDVIDFPFLQNDDYDDSFMDNDVKSAHSQGKVALCALGSMYEDAWQIRGYEDFLMDMMDDSPICSFLLDNIFKIKLNRAVAAARAGADLLTCGDDVANQQSMMFSKEIWRKYIKSRWAQVFKAARDIKPDIQIKYHSDGNVTDIVDELIEIGITILNPIQPECVNVNNLKEKYGKQLVFDGTIGTQTTLPFGTAQDVRDLVKLRKKEIGYDGGIILAPTHMVEPEVPLENILAFIDACKK